MLAPVASLEEIVCLEDTFVLLVGKALEHRGGVEIPLWSTRHDVHSIWPENRKVHGCVSLLHESKLLGSPSNPTAYRPGTDHPLHQKLSSEAQDNRVEGDKCNVVSPFTVHDRTTLRFRGVWVRQEYSLVERIRLGGIDGVAAKDSEHNDQRVEPGVS